jgi:hypothetical protein
MVGRLVAVRVSVPPGVFLFLPLLNFEADNVCVDPPLTIDQLKQEAAQVIDATTELHAMLDGSAISDDLFGFRVKSPVFSYVLPPDDNLAQFFGCDVDGTVTPAVGDGYYLMLPPLPRGQHTIDFGGTLGSPYDFSLDITYDLTVTG